MAPKPSKRATRSSGRKSKRKATRKITAANREVHKTRLKAAVKGGVRKPKLKTYRAQAVAKGPERPVDEPIIIEERREVETSDALLFPSGRPIRKR